jgi:hypothetical protein
VFSGLQLVKQSAVAVTFEHVFEFAIGAFCHNSCDKGLAALFFL